MSKAFDDVKAERDRQISAEGWTPEHDDDHRCGELASAAAAYAHVASYGDIAHAIAPAGSPPDFWPWEDKWWKPADPRRMLVKAGALILAEIERLDRAGGQ